MTLLQQLREDFCHLDFVVGQQYSYLPDQGQITYTKPLRPHFLLHELGHHLLGHYYYRLDIELLKLEAAAWEKARFLGKKYGLTIAQTDIDQSLNTYRDWLIARCRCPDCDLTGLQSKTTLQYECPNCLLQWSVSTKSNCLVRRRKLNA